MVIPFILIDTRKAAKHGAASVEVTDRSNSELRVAGHGPS